MSDGIFRRFVADQIAVWIVIVTCDYRALSVYNGHYIALKIGDVVVENTIVLQRIGIAVGIVEEVQGVAAKAFPQQFTTGIIVGVLNTVDCLTGSQTVGIIGVADSIGAVAGICEPSALRPCERPTVTVIVAGGIAHGIVGDTLAINRSQQVLPARIPIGVGMPIAGQDVAHSIVGVRIGRRTIHRTEKLVLRIIGIGYRSIAMPLTIALTVIENVYNKCSNIAVGVKYGYPPAELRSIEGNLG